MKILGISFSPRAQGNTVFLLNEALQGAKQEGAETELYSVAGKDIKGCDGCRACGKTGLCHIQDDMQEIYEKLLAADGIIFGAPVYFYGMTAQAKAVVDRTIAFGVPGRSLVNKVGGIITVAGSLGLVDVLKDFYFYMATRQIIPANYVAAYAGATGELAKMEQCMKATRNLGRQMAQIAAMGFKYPAEFERPHTAFGTHTR
jgi:multimeric flavodoxin WrbA